MKFMEVLKRNGNKAVYSVIGIMIGLIIGLSVNRGTENELISEIENVVELESEVTDLQASLKESESKVSQASEWFKMSDNEKKKLEQENEKQEAILAEEQAKIDEEEQAKAQADAQAELEASSIELSNGNYVSGDDFEEGYYDITAIDGDGNVSSDNMYSGGINAIMGTSGGDLYEKEYSNIYLPVGTTLSIDGVTIKLVPNN